MEMVCGTNGWVSMAAGRGAGSATETSVLVCLLHLSTFFDFWCHTTHATGGYIRRIDPLYAPGVMGALDKTTTYETIRECRASC